MGIRTATYENQRVTKSKYNQQVQVRISTNKIVQFTEISRSRYRRR